VVVCGKQIKFFFLKKFGTFLKGMRCKVAPGLDMRLPRNGDMCRCFGAEIKFHVY
jgi:hypothetical protein